MIVHAVTAFTHLDRHFRAGEEVPKDDPMVLLAPHLFESHRAFESRHAKAESKVKKSSASQPHEPKKGG